jgi:hypothetical protein
LLLIAAAIVVVALLLLLPYLFGDRDPAPSSAPQKRLADCSTAGLTVPPGAGAVTLGALRTSGSIEGTDVLLPRRVTIRLTGNLTIVSVNDLVIQGSILFPRLPRGPVISKLTLVSLQGTVQITSTASVGGGYAPFAPGSTATGTDAVAICGPPFNGAHIRIIGRAIDIQGVVVAQDGGDGSVASALATGLGTIFGFGPTLVPRGGAAQAAAADGGFGGDVLLCARDGISIGRGAMVLGGGGGYGGIAAAMAANGSRGFARGGSGGTGGDVRVVGITQLAEDGQLILCPVDVVAGAMVVGGQGGYVGTGTAVGGLGQGFSLIAGGGGDALAVSGDGGPGGTVLFNDGCVVDVAGVVRSGDGATPLADAVSGIGSADATGGNGPPARFRRGYDGGDARALGGNGGVAGAIPRIPTIGGLINGQSGAPGSGTNAIATPGTGGRPIPPSVRPGMPGTAFAKGGRNAAGDEAMSVETRNGAAAQSTGAR